ncbi:PREDICTED: B3 domain-containing protein At5g26805-like [Nelumbo nucifera]|nr:PREDICTED: B3 domain-containing protein At5g26805-like [Nelumbo nucifera]
MKKTVFNHFLQSKEEEEKEKKSGAPRSLHAEWMVIRDEPPQLLDLYPWEIKKVLTESDVGRFNGLDLDYDHVCDHILPHWDRQVVCSVINRGEQVPIVVRDLDTCTKHNLYLRKWANDTTFTIHNYWTKEFVERRGLKEGELIGMYWDPRSSSLCFSVLNRTSNSS